MLQSKRCEDYMFFHSETSLANTFRAFLYFGSLAYCFVGLSTITSRFFRSMEHVVKQTKKVVHRDPSTNTELVRYEKVWNYAIADIALLAFGTSFPQISLATIDAIQNIGQLYAGGLGPSTLVGSAAFDLFLIHAVCVVVLKATSMKKISDIGLWLVELFWSFWAYVWLYIILKVWTPNVVTLWEASLTVFQYGLLLLHAYAQDKRLPYVFLPISRSERPKEWVPAENAVKESVGKYDVPEIPVLEDTHDNDIADIFSIHSQVDAVIPVGPAYHFASDGDILESKEQTALVNDCVFSSWKHQFLDAATLGSYQSRKRSNLFFNLPSIVWQLIRVPWRFLFALVPPYRIAHGWIAFICSLIFISGITYIVTKLTNLISCVTGINPYVIAFTALASGTSWPNLVASKIAAERQQTADSAIANITCSNAVNIYVGIGIPWFIDAAYNHFVHGKPLYITNAADLGFSLLVFFATSTGCITILALRRWSLGAELGGPRLWAWGTFIFFMLLWLVFIFLSSSKISGTI